MSHPQEIAIRALGLKKSFGALQALDGIHFEVPVGSVFCILGSNGAGKTTLINLLTTITRPDEGRIEILGLDIHQHPILVRHNLGIVSQDSHFETYFTILENLKLHAELHGLSKKDYEPRIEMLLNEVGLWDRRNHMADQLSGGMRRRVTLIRALLHEPKVLFLDEPTTGLDPVARRKIWETIRQFSKKATVVLTTHYMEEADVLSDEILLLSHGHMVMTGSPQELKARMTPQSRYEIVFKGPHAPKYEKRIEAYIEKNLEEGIPTPYVRLHRVNDYRLEINLPSPELLSDVFGLLDAPELVRFSEMEGNLESVFLSVANQPPQKPLSNESSSLS